MDRLHEIEVFIKVAEVGSFAKAARQLRLSPPAVTRAISALEDRLGAQLFQRTTRRVAMTETGQRFLAGAKRLVADLDAIQKEAVGELANPQGHLTISASVTFGRIYLPEVIGAFRKLYPQMIVTLNLGDRIVNLIEEGIDVAVRIGHLPDTRLLARKVGEVRRLWVASPTYLQERGTPTIPAELSTHQIIAFTGLLPHSEVRFLVEGKSQGINLHPGLEVNDATTAIRAAELGQGITCTLSYMVASQIKAGTLVSVLDPFAAPPQPVHLVFPEARLVAPKTRAFVDCAAPLLKRQLDGLSEPTKS